jgi:regulator of protease activity HflC (stomatin/prohibitin superfamily)
MKEFYQKIRQKIRSNLSQITAVVLMFLFLFFYLYNHIVYTIQSGEGGVKYLRFFGGTVVDKVYPEGIHFVFPWDKLFIYNVRIQQVAHDFDVLTKSGLKVRLSISIRYYPEYKLLGILHQKVGMDYVNTIVIPEVESVLRVLVGTMEAEEVYKTEKSIYENALNQAVERVAQRFVNVDVVIIKKIDMPDSVEKAIREKIEQKHIAEAHIFRIEREKRESERKRIEAEGIKTYNDILASSLSNDVLHWMGINATLELSKSDNAKVVIIGNPKDGLPIIGAIPMDGDIGKLKQVKSPTEKKQNPVSPENKSEAPPVKLQQATEKAGNTALPEAKKESSQK